MIELDCHIKMDIELVARRLLPDHSAIQSVIALMAEHPSVKRVEVERAA